MKIFNEDLTKELQEKDINVEEGKLIDKYVKFNDEYEYIFIYVPYTPEELRERHISALKDELESLSQDFIQAELGAVIDDMEDRKERFKLVHNELREILGKEPREYEEK